MTKTTYADLEKQYKLPALSELSDFDIESIDEKDLSLRAVAQKINDRHGYYADLLESLVNPEQTLTAIHESQAFTDAEREHMLVLLQKLMHTYRTFTFCDLEKKDFEKYISDVLTAWTTNKAELHKILRKLSAAWLPTVKLKAELEYLG